MKPRRGREIIFGAEADQEPEEQAFPSKLPKEPVSKKVDVPPIDPIEERPKSPKEKPQPIPGSSKLGSKKYDDFMRFMEGIEEEMTSQYERSSQREKHRSDLEDFNSPRKRSSPPR
jgi:hypothetical protein